MTALTDLPMPDPARPARAVPAPTARMLAGPSPDRVHDQYRLIIMQPTTLCNLNCTYCYLPGRKSRNDMRVEVAEAVAADIAAQDADHLVIVLWHCGEPLTTPIDHFARLLAPFEPLRLAGRIHHSLQTNATLVTDEWCELLARYEVGVGVSLDGPAHLDTARPDRAGRPTYDRAMAGVETLRRHGFDTHVICVVTKETISRGAELMRYFHEQRFQLVSVNLEEVEGVNTSRPRITDAEARQFWRDAFAYIMANEGAPRIREMGMLARHLAGGPPPAREPTPTITWDGGIVLLSPELAGMRDPVHGDFTVANILHEGVQSVLARRHDIGYVAEFEAGLAACRDTCSFWSMCLGAYASNRWAEHGRFDVAETTYCRTTRQAPVHAALDLAAPTDHAVIAKLSQLTGRTP